MGPLRAGAQRLVLDIGNTSTTMAVFGDGPDPLVRRVQSGALLVPGAAADTFRKLSLECGPFSEVAICSVVPGIASLCAEAISTALSVPVVPIGSGLRLPFTLSYENSNAFGADRLALCAWSSTIFSGRAHIAVDIGTAITFDVLDSKGGYVGGLIMPGIDVMAGALHSRTAQLPLVGIDSRPALLGRSTGECIRSGIFWGAVKQVEGLVAEIVRYLREELGEAEVGVIATGGNSRLIADEIASIDVVDELAVLRGTLLLLELNPP